MTLSLNTLRAINFGYAAIGFAWDALRYVLTEMSYCQAHNSRLLIAFLESRRLHRALAWAHVAGRCLVWTAIAVVATYCMG